MWRVCRAGGVEAPEGVLCRRSLAAARPRVLRGDAARGHCQAGWLGEGAVTVGEALPCPPLSGPGCVPRAQGEAVPGLHRAWLYWDPWSLVLGAGQAPGVCRGWSRGHMGRVPTQPWGHRAQGEGFPPEADPHPRSQPPLPLAQRGRPGLEPEWGPCRPAPSGEALGGSLALAGNSSEVGSAGPFWAAGVPLGGSCCPGLLSFSLDVQPRDVGRTQARLFPLLTVRPEWTRPRPPDLALCPGTGGGPRPQGMLTLWDGAPGERRVPRGCTKLGAEQACGGLWRPRAGAAASAPSR